MTLSLIALVACDKTPPEVVAKDPQQQKPATPPPAQTGAATTTPATTAIAPTATGPIDLKTALDGVTGTGALIADLDTDGGKLTCKLYEDKAPITVGNFVGLARGVASFKDPVTKVWTKRAAYDGVPFHRIIKGFMVQGGDPSGTGMGDPGYNVPDEIWEGSKHDRAGLLCMANHGKNTNGMQFFITDDTAPHLDGNYTIFGECSPVSVVHKLASTPVGPDGEKPIIKPKILSVKIRREKP